MDFKSLTTATLAPILSTPNLTAVSFPSSGSPCPQITVNSAFVMRFPIPTSHQKIPFTGKGSLDEYAYSFLSDLAELHLIFFSFSISHVLSSTMLLVAPESTNIGSLMPPTEKVILSILLSSFTTNANSWFFPSELTLFIVCFELSFVLHIFAKWSFPLHLLHDFPRAGHL